MLANGQFANGLRLFQMICEYCNHMTFFLRTSHDLICDRLEIKCVFACRSQIISLWHCNYLIVLISTVTVIAVTAIDTDAIGNDIDATGVATCATSSAIDLRMPYKCKWSDIDDSMTYKNPTKNVIECLRTLKNCWYRLKRTQRPLRWVKRMVRPCCNQHDLHVAIAIATNDTAAIVIQTHLRTLNWPFASIRKHYLWALCEATFMNNIMNMPKRNKMFTF